MLDFGRCGGGGRRKARRIGAPLLGHYTTVLKRRSIVLVDLSCTGARIRGNDLPALDEELVVHAEGLSAFGAVAWSDADECGIRFDLPLDATEVEKVREKAPRGMSPQARAAFDDWNLGVAR
ncbi:PilZ domain-containing protein [Sphingomonas arenae]|uniref:PilZ domain-containing protein n=1 Tax=Sphingomonas arenae TaxID=2812555 RepID=UPI0019673C62